LHLEHCSRFNPYDGISWCFISFLSIVEYSQACWQIVQYCKKFLFFLFFISFSFQYL
jgi:hypothetical protein